ncbi:tripartite-type tricarboxylate transporter receptor subunit TctC [Bradyrhizobium sp. AZCC 1614]
MISRRTAICLAVIGLSTAASVGSVSAADYPTRPVKWVVGYPPGGATDIIARLIGQRLSERLGQQFVIENKPGAGNNIATESVINAEPDGYTLLLVNPANYINATLYANLKFNVVRDLAPIAAFNRVPNVMTVNKDVPAKTAAEFIAYVKANPGKVNPWPRPATARPCIYRAKCSWRCPAPRCSTCPIAVPRPRSPICSVARSS